MRNYEMEPFDKPYWSRRQVELWVCTRSRNALRLADYGFADLSLGPYGIDDERYDDGDPPIEDEGELYCTAIIRYGSVCSRDDALKEVAVALSDRKLRAYPDPEGGNFHGQFFVRERVLKEWPEKPDGGFTEALLPVPHDNIAPKHKGGRRAPWVRHLRKFLNLRRDRGHDIHSMTFAALRRDFLNYASQHQIPNVPERSSFETQLKKVLLELASEDQEREQRERDTAPSIAEITLPPGIRSK